MLDEPRISALMERIRRLRAPVVSLYIDCSRDTGQTVDDVLVHAKSTMDGLDLPLEAAKRIEATLGSDLPMGHVAAIFAQLEPFEVDVIPLPVKLPVRDPQTGRGIGRIGEPYLTPLLAAMDDREYFAVLYADRERWRLLRATTMTIEELASGERESRPGEHDRRDNSKQESPAYVADRGAASNDDIAAHLEDARRAFFRRAIEHTRQAMKARSLTTLVVMGPGKDAEELAALLPAPMIDQLVGVLGGLPDPTASPGRVLEHIEGDLRRFRQERESEVLDAVGERGVKGVGECLDRWQQGQLDTVVVPWHSTATVYVADETGYVAPSRERAAQVAADGGVSATSLDDVLPQLATSFGVSLEFVAGDRAERVVDEFGGMGGLARW